MPRYDHACTLAFSVKTDHDAEHLTVDELLDAIAARLTSLRRNPDEVLEATLPPYDTEDREDDQQTAARPPANADAHIIAAAPQMAGALLRAGLAFNDLRKTLEDIDGCDEDVALCQDEMREIRAILDGLKNDAPILAWAVTAEVRVRGAIGVFGLGTFTVQAVTEADARELFFAFYGDRFEINHIARVEREGTNGE